MANKILDNVIVNMNALDCDRLGVMNLSILSEEMAREYYAKLHIIVDELNREVKKIKAAERIELLRKELADLEKLTGQEAKE